MDEAEQEFKRLEQRLQRAIKKARNDGRHNLALAGEEMLEDLRGRRNPEKFLERDRMRIAAEWN